MKAIGDILLLSGIWSIARLRASMICTVLAAAFKSFPCNSARSMQGEGSEDEAECDAEPLVPHPAQFYRAVARTFAKQVCSPDLPHACHVSDLDFTLHTLKIIIGTVV